MCFSQSLPWIEWSKPAAPRCSSLQGIAGGQGRQQRDLQQTSASGWLTVSLEMVNMPSSSHPARGCAVPLSVFLDDRYLLHPKSDGPGVNSQGSWFASKSVHLHFSLIQARPFSRLKEDLFKAVQTFDFVLVACALMWFLHSSLFYGNQMFCQHFSCYVHQLRKTDALGWSFQWIQVLFLFSISEIWLKSTVL